LAGSALLCTHLAGATAAMVWLFIEWLKTGKPTVLGAISGAVAGLAIITPASGFTTPMYAMIIGGIGGVVCFIGATTLKQKMGYDDSLDAFGVHGVSGVVGVTLTGVFAVASVNEAVNIGGLVDGNGKQVLNQLGGAAVTVVLCVVLSFVLLKITNAVCGLRVAEEEEFDGLDLSQHGESGYNLEEDVFAVAQDEPQVAASETIVRPVPVASAT
jgi:Amt family ammonium transporter